MHDRTCCELSQSAFFFGVLKDALYAVCSKAKVKCQQQCLWIFITGPCSTLQGLVLAWLRREASGKQSMPA